MSDLLSVSDELDAMDGVAPQPQAKVEPFVPATLPDAPKLPPPGIYFGMPEAEYQALPALSASGIKDILASPMQYWAKATWLSEVARKREKREADNPKSQVARIVGRAYHCRLLEGAGEYAKRFCRELTPEDCEGALATTDEIKAAIKAKGEKPVSKVPDRLPDGTAFERSAKKEDWEAQLIRLDPDAKILSLLQSQHGRANAGKAFISADAWDQIEIAARMVELDPGCKDAFKGGYPEVVLIWYCAETGVPMKARADRLKLKMITDLKTIAVEGRSMETACARAIANYRYNYQPSVYCEGAQAVKALVRASFYNSVFIHEDTEGDEITEWAIKWAAETDEPKFMFVFQAKGDAPITRGMFYPMGGTTRMITDDMIRTAKRKFKDYSEELGTEPWLDIAPVYDLNDDDIPKWATDI